MKIRQIGIGAFILLIVAVLSCKDAKNSTINSPSETKELSEEDLYRPNFHFSPKNGWMNDPNGMFYYNGYYHLYFQHYPNGNKWGPMHWGHALSTDLVNWREQPIALYPDELGYIFSGSAVVDHQNTSGFGKDGATPIVAIYTYHDPKKEGTPEAQTQAIAYSLDEGLSWTKYQGNPVIRNPGIIDFRDPKVFWDALRSQWVMTLAAGQETHFYTSGNLKEWKFQSTFGKGIGNHDGVWECPDLFPLEVQGSDTVKWVHLVSINPGGPNGGSATQYFIGDFDGTRFTVDDSFAQKMEKAHTYWADFGKDNYAGVTWSDIPATDGRRIFMGWMSNWQYANEVPTETWRSTMTVARELQLVQDEYGYSLRILPVSELESYRGTKYKEEGITIKGSRKLIDSEKINLGKAEIKFEISDLLPTTYTFRLTNDQGDELALGYDHTDQSFFIDRSRAGVTDFSENFGDRISVAPKTYTSESLKCTILLDKTSLELFFDEGRTVMTEIVFPKAPFKTLILEAENQEVTLDFIEVHELVIN